MLYVNYHEKLKRGTDDFPIEFYHVDSNHSQYYMPIHWHVEFKFIHVIQGNLSLTLNDKTMNISKHNIVFIPSGFLHSAIPDNNCIYDCIVLDPDMLIVPPESCRKFIGKIIKHEFEIPYIYDETLCNIRDIIWRTFDALDNRPFAYELVVKGSLLEFFGTILSENLHSEVAFHTQRNMHRIDHIKQALEYIEANYAHPLTLQEISSSIGMSPKYFCRFFKEMTNRKPFDYLNFYRIERACDLLQTTNLPIAEICHQCGFNDLSYFIKTFKKHKGTTPKQYIK